MTATTGDNAVFQDAPIIVGVTGGIAAYKSCMLVSRLAQAGADVTVLMTEAATRFVGPITLQALSGNHVYTSPWEHVDSQDPQHVSLARGARAIVIAPCSMNCIAKLALGLTDDVVTLACSAADRSTTPTLLAPAMNASMWAQPSTQRNMATCKSDGFRVIGPDEGWQACRTSGAGRMSEPDAIFEALRELIA